MPMSQRNLDLSGLNLSALDPRGLIGTGEVGLLTATGSYDVERYAWAYDFWNVSSRPIGWVRKCPLAATSRIGPRTGSAMPNGTC